MAGIAHPAKEGGVMEIATFDALTRTLSGTDASRRQALRVLGSVLLGGALRGVAGQLGFAGETEATAKKRGKGHDNRNPSNGSLHAAGKGQKKHKSKNKNKNKNKDKHDDTPNDPPPPDTSCEDDPAPLCNSCQEIVCDQGHLVCRSKCQTSDAVCCGGECFSPCTNGCDISEDCGACNKPPADKPYCAAKNICVSTSCPEGQYFDAASCQCKEGCPAGVSMACPPVPARDDWRNLFGDRYSLPQGCCGIHCWFIDGQGIAYCSAPDGVNGQFWKCDD
jgi:hypothetical protein